MMRFILLPLLLLSSLASGFVFPQPMTAMPTSSSSSTANTDHVAHFPKTLSVQLDIGDSSSSTATTATASSRMSISGLVLQLLSSPMEATEDVVMSSASSASSLLKDTTTSTLRSLKVCQEGSFIDMMGKQTVHTNQSNNGGSWEMIWNDGGGGGRETSGSLICSLDIAKPYHRNDATLPQGRIYFSFPVWTQEGLERAQATKQRAMRSLQERDSIFDKVRAEPNLLRKAFLYQEATAAMNRVRFYTSRLSDYERIPDKKKDKKKDDDDDDDIIVLNENLLLSARGLVFTWNSSSAQVLLGTALMAAHSSHDHFEEEEEESTIVVKP